jgi:hypothetical protein
MVPVGTPFLLTGSGTRPQQRRRRAVSAFRGRHIEA